MLRRLAKDTMERIADTAENVTGSLSKALDRGEELADAVSPRIGEMADRIGDGLRGRTRRLGASIRPIKKKKAPKTLTLVGFIGLVLASFYLMKLFGGLQSLLGSDGSATETLLSAFVVCVVFFQYMTYVTTVFRLSSGMRQAWANMVRLSGSYVLLMIIANSHVLDFLSVNLVVTNSWILAGVMMLIMAYMLLPMVRSFFTPSYEDDVPLKEWIKLVFWMDPYKDSDGIELGTQTS